MTLKSDAKFEEKLTLGSKNDMKNLMNFNASSSISENLHFHVLLFSKIYCLSQSTEELLAIILENDAKFKEELTRALKNDIMNLANFDPRLESLKFAL